MKIHSITVILVASVGILCSRLHAQGISVTITPPSDTVVNPATGIQLTADATSSGDGACITFDWADEDGDWGAGSVSGLESVLNYYPEGDVYGTDDTVTCAVTDGAGDTAMDDVELQVPLITSFTEQTTPSASDSRTRIAIGEEVDLNIQPADIPGISDTNWTNSGAGTFSTTTGTSPTYTAWSSPETDTLTATLGDANSTAITITFTVIGPNATNQTQAGSAIYAGNTPIGVYFQENVYMGPDYVNFYNCQFQEGACSANASGYFAALNGLVHDPAGNGTGAIATPIQMSNEVTAGLGTSYDRSYLDNVKTYTASLTARPLPTYSPGSFVWPIPDNCICNGIQISEYSTTNHDAELTDSGGYYSEKLTKSQGNVTSSSWYQP